MEIQWALVLFTVVAGAGAWLFAWSVISGLCKKSALPTKKECMVSFALLVVGGCLSVLHLKHVDRILEALNHPTSGIFIEAAGIGIMCVLVAIYFVMILRNSGEKPRMIVGILGAVVGIAFTYACGHSYIMEARPAWVTQATPLSYACTAAAAGAALNLLCKIIDKQDEGAIKFSGLLTVIGTVLGIALSAAFCIHAGSVLAVSTNGAMTWAVVTFVCLAVTLVCGVVAMVKPQYAMLLAIVALVTALVACTTIRMVMWLTGNPVMDFFLMPMD